MVGIKDLLVTLRGNNGGERVEQLSVLQRSDARKEFLPLWSNRWVFILGISNHYVMGCNNVLAKSGYKI